MSRFDADVVDFGLTGNPAGTPPPEQRVFLTISRRSCKSMGPTLVILLNETRVI